MLHHFDRKRVSGWYQETCVFDPDLVHPFGINQFALIRSSHQDGLQKLQYLIEAKQFPSSSALLRVCCEEPSLPKSLILGLLSINSFAIEKRTKTSETRVLFFASVSWAGPLSLAKQQTSSASTEQSEHQSRAKKDEQLQDEELFDDTSERPCNDTSDSHKTSP